MTDIVERLRSIVLQNFGLNALGEEAADEIERLRAQVKELEIELSDRAEIYDR